MPVNADKEEVRGTIRVDREFALVAISAGSVPWSGKRGPGELNIATKRKVTCQCWNDKQFTAIMDVDVGTLPKYRCARNSWKMLSGVMCIVRHAIR